MKFLVDAHLPLKLVRWLKQRGHDVLHTSELPRKNRTEDVDLIRFAEREARIVITKDADFYNYFILKGEPSGLLLLTMGNITNAELIILFERNIDQVELQLEQNQVVELDHNSVTAHF